MKKQINRIQLAERGAKTSISIYLLLAIGKILTGFFMYSAALSADGFNNLTDVVSSIAVLIGLKTARKPADSDHPYGHWKAEAIASLVTSFIMLFVGFQVFVSSITRIIQETPQSPNLLAAVVALISTVILYSLYRYNLSLSEKVHSSGLKAVAKDNLADCLTSLATAIAIFGSSIGLYWLDGIMAIIVSLVIIKTGYEVFKENTFSLSDGFKDKELDTFKEDIASLPEVIDVPSIKARMYGANIYVDVTILVNGHMTVQEGHDVTEVIEKLLYDQYDVMYTDVHVEPKNLKHQFNQEQM